MRSTRRLSRPALSTTCLRRFVRPTSALVVVLFCACAGAQEQTVTIEDIRAAWQQRQDAVRTVTVEWNHQQTHGTKYLPSAVDDEAPSVTFAQRATLSLDGAKINYTRENLGEFDSERFFAFRRSAFDGREARSTASTTIPSGTIHADNHSPDRDLVYIKPLLLAFRPLHFDLGKIDLAKCTLSEQPELAGTTSCWILTQPDGDLVKNSCWLDPAREFALVRLESYTESKLIITVDVTHIQHPEVGWIPSQWSVVWISPEQKSLVESGVSEVVECTINGSVPADEFQIEFEPGTMVYDEARGTDFLVRADGGLREILRSERGASYEELLRTDTGMAARTASSSLGGLVWLSAVLAAITFVWCARRYWRKRVRGKSETLLE